MDKWISVKDRLPGNGEDVLCWYEYFRFGEYNRMFGRSELVISTTAFGAEK